MTDDLASRFDRVELAWSGELEGTLVPGYQSLFHVVLDADVPTPTGLPVIRLPAAPAPPPRALWPDMGILSGHLPVVDVRGRLFIVQLIEQPRGRALLLDSVRLAEHAELAWLDLATGALRPVARWPQAQQPFHWRCHAFERGAVLFDDRARAWIIEPDGTQARWPSADDATTIALGRDEVLYYRDGALERWSADGRKLRSRLTELQLGPVTFRDARRYPWGLGHFFYNIHVDALGRSWCVGGKWGLLVLDRDDRVLAHLPCGDFGEPEGLPYCHGLDGQGRLWFSENGYYTAYRVWELETGCAAPVLARQDDRSGLEPTL